jgi:hypothetical protein
MGDDNEKHGFQQKASRKKPHRGRWFLTGIIIGVIAAFATSIYLANSSFNIPFFGNSDNAPSIDVTVLQESMEKNSELSTAQYHYTDSTVISDQNDLSAIGLSDVNLPFTEATYVIQFNGTIKAGFDLSKAQVTKGGLPGYETIVVTLPAPQILSHEIGDVNCIYEDGNIMNPLHAGEESSWLDAQKQTMEEHADADGLYNQAKQYAKVMFEETFSDAIPEGTKIEVRFQQ